MPDCYTCKFVNRGMFETPCSDCHFPEKKMYIAIPRLIEKRKEHFRKVWTD